MKKKKKKRLDEPKSKQIATAAFKLYARDLHSYILRRTRQSNLAVDLTQDVFLRFLRVKNVEAVRNPQAYLFGIASRVIRDALLQRDQNIVTYDSELVILADLNRPMSPADFLEDQVALEDELNNALRKLPVMHRATLLLIKRDGLSYKETAKRLRLSESTVTRYVFEARTKIKALLEQRDKGAVE